MAQVNLLSHKLQDLQFFNKLEKPGQVALENNFSFNVNFTADNTRCVARLYQCVKDKAEDGNHKFFISVELTALFVVEGPVTDEDKKDIHVSCYQQMFPYAELAARQTCAMGGMPNFVLLRQKMNRNNVMLGRKNPETKS